MSVGTMTSKGQITVPKDVRDALGLHSGTRVTFTRNAEGDYVLGTLKGALIDLAGVLGGSGTSLTLDEMDAVIAEAARVP